MQSSVWKLPISDWKWWYILIAFIAMVVTPLIPTWLVQFVVPFTAEQSFDAVLKNYGQWFEIIKFALFVLIPILLIGLLKFRLASRADFPVLGMAKSSIGRSIWAIVIGYAFYAIATGIFQRTVEGAAEASEQVSQSLGLGLSIPKDIVVMFMVAVAAPIGEEFFFRGLLFRAIRDGLSNLSPWFTKNALLTLLIATLLSAYAFMSSHGGDGQDLQLYMIGLMGVIAAVAYAWSGSLLSGVMIHAINNAVALYSIGHFVDSRLAGLFLLLCPIITLVIMLVINMVLPRADSNQIMLR